MTLRRIVQSLMFALFLFLLFMTVFRERWEGLFPYLPVDLFLRLDPLALLATSLAERQWVKGLSLLIPLLVATVLLGRIFCGWICPLGTTLDLFEKITHAPQPVVRSRQEGKSVLTTRTGKVLALFSLRSKYYLLFALAVAALLGVQAAWIADPIPIVTRSYATVLLPAMEWGMRLLAGPAQQWRWSAEAYQWTQDNLLAFQQPRYLNSLAVLGVFLFIVLLSLEARRWWCRKLCPLGALLGLLSRWKLVRIRTAPGCTGCGQCATHCKMEAIHLSPQAEGKGWGVSVDNRECILCSTCIDLCPSNIMGYSLWAPKEQSRPVIDLPRRRVTAALVSGMALAPVVQLDFARANRDRAVLRPPCIPPEEEFLNRCIRCGECMKVCLTNVLQPAFGEAGLSGMFSPMMVTRYAYCAYDCTLCGQVCPTGAIPYFTLEHKHARSQGLAAFDRNRCIPYAEGRDCLVCEEHCPVSPKAIQFIREEVRTADGSVRTVKLPVVRPERCIGCGICENKCPVNGAAAVIVRPYSPQKSLREIARELPQSSLASPSGAAEAGSPYP